jgi:hypothetical protein
MLDDGKIIADELLEDPEPFRRGSEGQSRLESLAGVELVDMFAWRSHDRTLLDRPRTICCPQKKVLTDRQMTCRQVAKTSRPSLPLNSAFSRQALSEIRGGQKIDKTAVKTQNLLYRIE